MMMTLRKFEKAHKALYEKIYILTAVLYRAKWENGEAI